MRHSRLDRRHFLVGSASLLLTGCSAAAEPAQLPSSAQHPSSTPGPVHDVSALLDRRPFYVAHRGSGDNWTEHTLLAYEQSLAAGAHAVEISVSRTADGVFVCHHDTNLARLTGVDADIADLTWEEVSQLRNDARRWLGPATDTEPVPRLDDVLEALPAGTVAFVEDKSGSNADALLDLLDAQPGASERFVWKQWAAASSVTKARERGYACWGYVTRSIHERIPELSDRFDLIGVHHTASDDTVRTAVDTGRPVIVWEVHFRSQRDRLQRLGVQGMMCSNIPYVTTDGPRATTDAFASGRRAAGDLPWSVDGGWSHQPALSEKKASITFDREEIQSYGMGSLAPIASTTYVLSVALSWPKGVPDGAAAAGVAFCLDSDAPYRIGIPSEAAGYHALLRSNGQLELIARSPGDDNGNSLGSAATPPPKKGQTISLIVRVSPTDVRVSRDGDLSSEVSTDNAEHRGGYIALCKNYTTIEPVAFSSVTIE